MSGRSSLGLLAALLLLSAIDALWLGGNLPLQAARRLDGLIGWVSFWN